MLHGTCGATPGSLVVLLSSSAALRGAARYPQFDAVLVLKGKGKGSSTRQVSAMNSSGHADHRQLCPQ